MSASAPKQNAATFALTALILGSVLTAGCGGDGDSTDTAGGERGSSESQAQDAQGPSRNPEQAVYKFGDEASIEGEVEENGASRGIHLRVKPLEYEDPAENNLLRAEEVEPNTRWVRVELQIKNRGDQYSTFEGQWTIYTVRGETALENLSSAPWSRIADEVLPGDTARGSIGILVPAKSPPKELRFEPFIGSGEVVRWDLTHAGN